jgi:predicted alpha/beta-fold hydrolase
MMLSFRPLPLLGNPHVQTVLGNLLPGPVLTFPCTTQVVALPDGDGVVLHDCTPPEWRCGDPIAVLIHGLGGSHASPNMVRVNQRLANRGVRVCRMDLRGSGAGVALARRFYSAACSDDVRAVLDHLHVQCPDSPLLLAGFSLGASIVLKLAGEAGDRPVPGLRAIATVAAPLDLMRCSEQMERLPIYDAYFVRHLTQRVYEHQRIFRDLPRIRFPRRLTIRQFDDIYTAPAWGFANALDYYRKASSLPSVTRSPVPTLLLTARDDPFVPVEPFETIPETPNLEIHIVDHGGHLGFLGLDGEGGIRWGERQVVDWLLKQVARIVGRSQQDVP